MTAAIGIIIPDYYYLIILFTTFVMLFTILLFLFYISYTHNLHATVAPLSVTAKTLCVEGQLPAPLYSASTALGNATNMGSSAVIPTVPRKKYIYLHLPMLTRDHQNCMSWIVILSTVCTCLYIVH